LSTEVPPVTVYEGEPEATIERHGRCSYWVDIHWGLMGISTAPWWRPGRRSAERKARRELRRWKAEADRESWTVRLPGAGTVPDPDG
jgi:hypothetical protein